MNRSEGLVQRRNVLKDSNSDGTLKENHDDDKKNDKSYDDGDSKETRLTLMEEVLLLGLKDKEVLSVGLYKHYISCVDRCFTRCKLRFLGLHIILE